MHDDPWLDEPGEHDEDAGDVRPRTLGERVKRGLRDAAADLRANGGAPLPLSWRDVFVMALVCVILTIFYYYARPNFYRRHLEADLLRWLAMEKSHWRTLFPYFYWTCTSLTLRLFIPLATIVLLFRDDPRDYGFQLWKRGHGKIYAGMYLFMLPLLLTMSFTTSFQSKYPFYKMAGERLDHFILYEISYGLQFMSLEAFFRGFMIFALFKRFGYQAVVIMTIPYCMIHFGKPIPETLGAVVAGLALGFMAIKSKSWLPGALLHWSVGFTMDIVCLVQTGRWKLW
ncbi:MAG: type II CAAX endopeptidase family protein [Myxococcota bacterium]